MSPEATVIPSFIHDTSGVGFPVALQWNVAMWPSMTVWKVELTVQLGGSTIDKVLI